MVYLELTMVSKTVIFQVKALVGFLKCLWLVIVHHKLL